jgi:hypothetical protein
VSGRRNGRGCRDSWDDRYRSRSSRGAGARSPSNLSRPVPRAPNRRSTVTRSSDSGAEADVRLWLEGHELVVARLAGLGASLFVTTYRLVIVRDGARRRPRSGIQSWPHDSIHRVSPPKRGQARIAVRAGPRPEGAVSMFFAAEFWPNAEHPRRDQKSVESMALAMTRLVFAGDTAEVIETIKSNVRHIPQAT